MNMIQNGMFSKPANLILLAIIPLMAFALSSCGGDAETKDDGVGADITATDGDGIPEMNGQPTFSLSSVVIDTPIDVNVTVDSDTTYVSVEVGIYDGATFNIYGSSGTVAVTPGITNAVSVTPSSFMSAVPGTYVASVITCNAATCLMGNPGRWYTPGNTYMILNLVDISLVEATSVVPNTFTATAL